MSGYSRIRRYHCPVSPKQAAGTTERADAAANRRRILDAAALLFAEHGPDVTMTEVAAAAGVGRGTLYRRYSSVSAIAVALLDEAERELQQQLISGPPPLGPGAVPHDRLVAFYSAMIDLLEQHLPLVLGAETGRRRFSTGAYGFWRTHIAAVLRDAGIRDTALPDLLLAPLSPDLYRYQREDRGLSPTKIKRAAHRLADAIPK